MLTGTRDRGAPPCKILVLPQIKLGNSFLISIIKFSGVLSAAQFDLNIEHQTEFFRNKKKSKVRFWL
jgi:hypothetical protein